MLVSVKICSIRVIRVLVVYVPDTFTPNRDGLNDVLTIYGTGAAQMTLTIYNRWGELICKATDGASSPLGRATWNGTYRGQPVMSGLYIYRLDGNGADFPGLFTRKGFIEVVR